MITDVAPLVHTQGVNVEATVAIVASVVGIMSVVLGFFARWVARQITGAINQFRIDVIFQLDTRLTRLENSSARVEKRQTRDD